MLNKVSVSTPMPGVPVLLLDELGAPETDFIQVKHIDGLDPNKATISMMSYGLTDGEAHLGSDVPSRNIVLTLGPNPDWISWTFESLRQLIYSYFMPKNSVKLVFDSDEVGLVTISGIVEDVLANQFTKDPEYIVSVICPDPYFTAVAPIELSGDAGDSPIDISNNGNVTTGIYLKLTADSGSASWVKVQFDTPNVSYFEVDVVIDATHYFDMDSRPLHKFAREVDTNSQVITSRLSDIHEGSAWPIFLPGDTQFGVTTDGGAQTWELTYFERFGGI